MSVSIIYARSRNYCIGKNGDLPWHLPDEFDHFLSTTRGYPRIMGRRSYEDQDGTVASGVNIVVTSRPPVHFPPEVVVAHSLTQAIDISSKFSDRAFVIGGAGLFQEAFDHADEVFETIIDADIAGDTFITPFDFSSWHTELLSTHPNDQRHAKAFDIFRHSLRNPPGSYAV